MRKMKIIQVGVGGFGRSWVDIILNSSEWEAVGFVDINQEALKKIIKECNLPEEKCFVSLKECFKKVKADALLNITPPSFHKEITIDALREGLHVLVEKPLSDNMKDAEEMVEKAEKYGRKLMVSQNYRYRKIPRSIRKFIKDGKIGKISHILLNFQKGPRFSGFRIEMEYPLLKDMSIHHFDLMRYITGKNPINVYAKSWNSTWSWFKGDASISIIMGFEDGIQINYFGSWTSIGKETSWDGDWKIYGEKGSLFWIDDKLEFVDSKGKSKNVKIVEMKKEDRNMALFEFYNAIKEKREPETSGKDNIKSLEIVFKSLESIKKKIPVKIKN